MPLIPLDRWRTIALNSTLFLFFFERKIKIKLFRAMVPSQNLSIIFDQHIIVRQLNVLTNWTTTLSLGSVLIPQDLVGSLLIGG